MFVLGIDPGLTRCGYGMVQRTAKAPVCVSAGLLATATEESLPTRLATLSADLNELMDDLKPDVVVVERVFFQTNARTAMSVAQAAGLALVAAEQRNAEIVQYTANEVKATVTGDGAAVKSQTQQMVKQILGLETAPNPPDVADALALAICHLSRAGLHARLRDSGAVVANQKRKQVFA